MSFFISGNEHNLTYDFFGKQPRSNINCPLKIYENEWYDNDFIPLVADRSWREINEQRVFDNIKEQMGKGIEFNTKDNHNYLGMKIKGKTLINLVSNRLQNALVTSSSANKGYLGLNNVYKNNTPYTIIYTINEIKSGNDKLYLNFNGGSSSPDVMLTDSDIIGTHVQNFSFIEELKPNLKVGIYHFLNSGVYSEKVVSDVMIFEGTYTEQQINDIINGYVDGMKSVADNKQLNFKSIGKNMFSSQKLKDLNYQYGFTLLDSNTNTFQVANHQNLNLNLIEMMGMKLKGKPNITISLTTKKISGSGGGGILRAYFDDGTDSYVGLVGGGNFRKTYDKKINKLVFSYANSGVTEFSYVMISETDSDFEPYQESAKTINLSNSLNDLNDNVYDYVDFKDDFVYRRTWRERFDGGEGVKWNFNKTTNNTLSVYTMLSNCKKPSNRNDIYTTTNNISSICESDYDKNNDIEGIFINQNSQILQVGILKSKLIGYNDNLSNTEKVNLFKTYLRANPLDIVYLVEPYTEPLSLGKYALKSHNGITHIIQVSDGINGIISTSVGYGTDLNNISFSNSSGEYLSVDNSVNGVCKDMIVKGRTLHNLLYENRTQWIMSGIYKKTDYDFESIGNVTYPNIIAIPTFGLVEGNTYTMLVYVKASIKPINSFITYRIKNQDDTNNDLGNLRITELDKLSQGIFLKSSFIASNYNVPHKFEGIQFALNYSTAEEGKGCLITFKPMLLEGDWTNKEIPSYFEGIKSVSETSGKISILTCGKNLNPETQTGNLSVNTGNEIEDINRIRSGFIRVVNGKNYILSLDGVSRPFIKIAYNLNKEFMYKIEDGDASKFISNHNGYIRAVRYKDGGTNYQIQCEEGIQVTPHESYKEDKRDIPLPNGLREWNNIDFNSGELISGTGKRVFTGVAEELWRVYPYNVAVDIVRFTLILDDALNINDFGIISDRFNRLPNLASNFNNTNEFIASINKGIYISIAKNKLIGFSDSLSDTEKVNLFKIWLSNNPMTLYYQSELVKTPLNTIPNNTNINLNLNTNKYILDDLNYYNGGKMSIEGDIKPQIENYDIGKYKGIMIEIDMNDICRDLSSGDNAHFKSLLKRCTLNNYIEGGSNNNYGCNFVVYRNDGRYSDIISGGNNTSSLMKETLSLHNRGGCGLYLTNDNKYRFVIMSKYSATQNNPSFVELDYFKSDIALSKSVDRVPPINVSLKEEWSLIIKGVSMFDYDNVVRDLMIIGDKNSVHGENYPCYIRITQNTMKLSGTFTSNQNVVIPKGYGNFINKKCFNIAVINRKSSGCKMYLYENGNYLQSINGTYIQPIENINMYIGQLGHAHTFSPINSFFDNVQLIDYPFTDEEIEVALKGENVVDKLNPRLNFIEECFENPNMLTNLYNWRKSGDISGISIINNYDAKMFYKRNNVIITSPHIDILPNNTYELSYDFESDTGSSYVDMKDLMNDYCINNYWGIGYASGRKTNVFRFTTSNYTNRIYLAFVSNQYTGNIIYKNIKLKRID